MNPIYHLQWGWLAGHTADFDQSDRRKLMLASIVPDLDGVFIWNADIFHRMHHTFGHNVFVPFIVGGALAAFSRKGKRAKWFLLGFAMVALHLLVDLFTCPEYPLRFLWPVNKKEYYLLEMLGLSGASADTWNLILGKGLQVAFMVMLLTVTAMIYLKYGRTFIELISSKLDKFLTDFAILPFKYACEYPECRNRAHYVCAENGSKRCIKHCAINRDLTISCAGHESNGSPDG